MMFGFDCLFIIVVKLSVYKIKYRQCYYCDNFKAKNNFVN